VEWLLSKGYTIVTRRYQSKHGEIDIIAMDDDVLVFIEVKYRRSGELAPEAAVDDTKIQRMSATAELYANAMGVEDRPSRFDVIGVTPHEIRHHIDAFRSR
jgi:putative endonuclease